MLRDFPSSFQRHWGRKKTTGHKAEWRKGGKKAFYGIFFIEWHTHMASGKGREECLWEWKRFKQEKQSWTALFYTLTSFFPVAGNVSSYLQKKIRLSFFSPHPPPTKKYNEAPLYSTEYRVYQNMCRLSWLMISQLHLKVDAFKAIQLFIFPFVNFRVG